MVITKDLEDVPRLMSGLPDAEIISTHSPDLTKKLSAFLRPEAGKPETVASSYSGEQGPEEGRGAGTEGGRGKSSAAKPGGVP